MEVKVNKESFYKVSPPTSKNWELLFLNYKIIFLKKEETILWTYYISEDSSSLYSYHIQFFILSHFLLSQASKCSYPLFLSDRTDQIFKNSYVSFIYLHSTHSTKELKWFTLVWNRQLSAVDQMDTVSTVHYMSFLLVRDRKLLGLP